MHVFVTYYNFIIIRGVAMKLAVVVWLLSGLAIIGVLSILKQIIVAKHVVV